ncbi:hypothetical protein NOCA1120473 [metagenome]|uniref:ParB/Sulfiredoxin domain-containing protein n=1 Tax=metagenome TaxID=256318 RepID=A0A2P2C5N0_9ZZZZ
MTEVRKQPTAKEKKAIMASEQCYVCSDLGVEHAGFDGYESREVHMDHYQVPFSRAGGKTGDTLPIHAAAGGTTVDDPDFETSTRRNCHRLRRDDYTTRNDYVQVLRARLAARHAAYVDDVYENASRRPNLSKYKLKATWGTSAVKFAGKDYAVITEVRQGTSWQRFLTSLRPDQCFTDQTSQVRPANIKPLTKMIHTFLIEGFPMFAPINARIDRCGHVVIFDGNHRATAHALCFGTEQSMPVMIWDITPEANESCALEAPQKGA